MGTARQCFSQKQQVLTQTHKTWNLLFGKPELNKDISSTYMCLTGSILFFHLWPFLVWSLCPTGASNAINVQHMLMVMVHGQRVHEKHTSHRICCVDVSLVQTQQFFTPKSCMWRATDALWLQNLPWWIHWRRWSYLRSCRPPGWSYQRCCRAAHLKCLHQPSSLRPVKNKQKAPLWSMNTGESSSWYRLNRSHDVYPNNTVNCFENTDNTTGI